MSYAAPHPTNTRRSSLLGIVIGLHAGVFALVMAAKTVAPQIAEIPLIVDFIQPAPVAETPKVKPQPVAKAAERPQPARPPKATPTAATPSLEATSSPLATAAIASPAEVRPAPAAAAQTSPPIAAEPVTQARFDADYLRNPAPSYPPLSRRMGEEGKVILRVLVNPQGSADNVEIKTSSGSVRLDEAAQKTVRTWKFIAAKRGETPIQSWVLVPIVFKLEQ